MSRNLTMDLYFDCCQVTFLRLVLELDDPCNFLILVDYPFTSTWMTALVLSPSGVR